MNETKKNNLIKSFPISAGCKAGQQCGHLSDALVNTAKQFGHGMRSLLLG